MLQSSDVHQRHSPRNRASNQQQQTAETAKLKGQAKLTMASEVTSTSSSSSSIYYFDREGPTDVAVLLQGTLSALYRAKQKRIDAQRDDTRQAENSTYQRQGKK